VGGGVICPKGIKALLRISSVRSVECSEIPNPREVRDEAPGHEKDNGGSRRSAGPEGESAKHVLHARSRTIQEYWQQGEEETDIDDGVERDQNRIASDKQQERNRQR
jgi:hypothetical protein